MKKLFLTIATVVAAAVMVSSATATDTVYEAEGFGCGILLPDGSFATTFDSSFVIFASGKAVLRCEAQTDLTGDRVVLNPNNRPDVDCGFFNSDVGVVDLPFWNSKLGSNGITKLTCNGHVDLNADAQPDLRSSGGGTAGN